MTDFRITAALSFFDEPPEMLAACVERLAAVGVDKIVAVDGPYALYPHESTRSSPESVAALKRAAADHEMMLVLSQVDRPWEGNEVGKRQHLMRLALGARPKAAWLREQRERNWLLVVDSDHMWESDEDLHDLLSGSAADTARVSFAETFQSDGTPIYAPARPLLRVRFDLRMGTNHYTYETDDGYSTFLERPTPTLDVLDLSDSVRVVHLVHERDPERRARQAAFYHERDTRKIET